MCVCVYISLRLHIIVSTRTRSKPIRDTAFCFSSWHEAFFASSNANYHVICMSSFTAALGCNTVCVHNYFFFFMGLLSLPLQVYVLILSCLGVHCELLANFRRRGAFVSPTNVFSPHSLLAEIINIIRLLCGYHFSSHHYIWEPGRTLVTWRTAG